MNQPERKALIRRHDSRAIYLSVCAQEDNLGDIVIRRVAYDWIRDSGRVVVLTAGMSDSYVNAFDLDASTDVVANQRRFAVSFALAAVLGRAHLLFAPGPFQLRSSTSARLRSAFNALNAFVCRSRGGQVIGVGRSVRGSDVIGRRLQQVVVDASTLFAVRDDVSSDVVGRDLQHIPDLGFDSDDAVTVPSPEQLELRSKVALSFRGDRPLDLELVDRLIVLIRENSLDPIFVTQVRRDGPQHGTLAERYQADHVEWGSQSHTDQLRRVEAVYTSCHSVISDRLHALILGSVGGALPIAVIRSGTDKLPSTLDPFLRTQSLSMPLDVEELKNLRLRDGEVDRFIHLAQDMAEIRSRLKSVREACRRLLST